MFLQGEKLWRKIALTGSWWAFVIWMLMISPAGAGQPSTHIPSLNATVEGLLFYESARGFPPQKDRIYSTVFDKSQTMFINWELRLKHPKPGRKIEFPIHYKYFNPQGKMVTKYDINSYIEANWTDSNHTNGYNAGTWAPGTYRVDVYIAGDMVASGTFEVVSDKAEIPNQKEPNKKKIDIPDDLGEL